MGQCLPIWLNIYTIGDTLEVTMGCIGMFCLSYIIPFDIRFADKYFYGWANHKIMQAHENTIDKASVNALCYPYGSIGWANNNPIYYISII